MIRFFSCLLFLLLSACATRTTTVGGDRRYAYQALEAYRPDQLRSMASEIVQTSYRDPSFGKMGELFGRGQRPLKKIAVVVFESRIQPTYEGLAKENKVYLSEAGKQIITENFLRIWEQSFALLEKDIDFVKTADLKKSKAYSAYGSAEDNYIKSRRSVLAPDDIFFLEPGKKTTTTTVVNPRSMRDMSFLLVPANELMGGPKWSEHNKHFVNDLAKELGLDAVVIILSDVAWTAQHVDKHSGENIPEELKVELEASVLVPLSSYHQRLEKVKDRARPNVTLAYRKYDAELKIPVLLSVPEEEKNFFTIERQVIAPMMKTYHDLSQMVMYKIAEDLKRTW